MLVKFKGWYHSYDKDFRKEFNAEMTDVRYILGEEIDTNKDCNSILICIGANPSTALPRVLDPTLRRVQKYAQEEKYISWYMLNLYPQRATNPDDMHKKNEFNKIIHRKNIEAIKELLDELKDENIVVWCAWGTVIKKRKYLTETCLNEIIKLFADRKIPMNCAGRTTEGYPNHPLSAVKRDKDEMKKTIILEKCTVNEGRGTVTPKPKQS